MIREGPGGLTVASANPVRQQEISYSGSMQLSLEA